MKINVQDLKVGQIVKISPGEYKGFVSDIGVITEILTNKSNEVLILRVDVQVDYKNNYNNTHNLCFYPSEILEIIKED